MSVAVSACFVEIDRKQLIERVINTLGLKNAVGDKTAGSADRPVDRRNDRVAAGIDRSRTCSKLARKKVIEVPEVARYFPVDLCQAHVVQANESADERILDGFDPNSRDAMNDSSQPVPRQQILQSDKDPVEHVTRRCRLR